nr:hypothetical protein CFP56_21138 [Quercus suber]
MVAIPNQQCTNMGDLAGLALEVRCWYTTMDGFPRTDRRQNTHIIVLHELNPYDARKSSRSIIAMALLASPTVLAAAIGSPVNAGAPTRVKRAAGCTATVIGVNSEGGGGPGQAPINVNDFSVDIVSPNGSATGTCSATGSTDVPCDTVTAATYGGTIDTTCDGSWDGGSISWFGCTCNGVQGTVSPPNIETGTVSETTDWCIVEYDC